MKKTISLNHMKFFNLNELFYNNLQEAYNLFLDALDRANNIKDYVLIKNITFYTDDVKKKIDDLRLKEEMEFKKKLEAEKIERMNELKKMRFCNDKSITLKE